MGFRDSRGIEISPTAPNTFGTDALLARPFVEATLQRPTAHYVLQRSLYLGECQPVGTLEEGLYSIEQIGRRLLRHSGNGAIQ